MDHPPIDLVATLAAIRQCAVKLAAERWPELGTLLERCLPAPLNPMTLLPIATGLACAGTLEPLIDGAAALVLTDLALRIVDDCADADDPRALYLALGVGPAMSYALALNTIAGQVFARLADAHSSALLPQYADALLRVCQGQAADMQDAVATLADYRQVVAQKSVAAYGFAAQLGALLATHDPAQIARCTACGEHLGWMQQIFDDIEALWLPLDPACAELTKRTFPVLLGLESPAAAELEQLLAAGAVEQHALCAALDALSVRPRLFQQALDHRDAALEQLGPPLKPVGQSILQTWLTWLLRDGARLLDAAPRAR